MISSLLGKVREPGWTAVDHGPDGVFGATVLAPSSSAGRPRVAKCGVVPGADLGSDSLAALAKKIAVNGCGWTLPLSRKEYSILVIPEPPVLPAEMEQSVRWAISTMIDYPVEEASVAWMKIPTAEHLPNRPPHIYVIAARNELVNQRRNLFQNAKLPLQAIDVHETAQRNIAALAEKKGEGLGLLKVGRQGVQFTVTYNGELYLDRFVEELLFENADPEVIHRAFERIALQVQRSLDFISRTMTFIHVGRVLVAPMPAEIGLRDYIAQNLSEPVEALDLGSLFDFAPTPELRKPENQALYFTALGAALRFMKKTSA